MSECLEGNDRAWSALIAKYKNLIYSVPVRWGLPASDASDVFQSTVADLLSELGRLREPKALPMWLVQVASHRCIQIKKQQSRESQPDESSPATEPQSPPEETPEELLQESIREQMLRTALLQTPQRCRELIRMLFYEHPARPYPEVAAVLGLAVGSIGFIRRRCLDRLRKALEEAGFQ